MSTIKKKTLDGGPKCVRNNKNIQSEKSIQKIFGERFENMAFYYFEHIWVRHLTFFFLTSAYFVNDNT